MMPDQLKFSKFLEDTWSRLPAAEGTRQTYFQWQIKHKKYLRKMFYENYPEKLMQENLEKSKAKLS